MAIRVSTGGATSLLIQQMFDQRGALEKIRTQIATGTKVDVASEDTGQAGAILSLQALVGRIDRHQQRISNATATLEQQENVLNSSDNLLVRAKELAVQAANGSQSVASRALIAKEVWQLRDQLVSLANTNFQGRYIYGAADDDDPPFDATTYTQAPTDTTLPAYTRYAFDAEAGTSTTRSILINDTDTLRINTSGGGVFSRAIGALERLGRSLDGYRTTINATTNLPTGAGTAYNLPTDYAEQSNDILRAVDEIDYVRTFNFTTERSDVGSRISRLEQVTEILDNLRASSEENRAEIQDTDIYEASAQFSNLQLSLQALLSSGSQINNLSLLNFL